MSQRKRAIFLLRVSLTGALPSTAVVGQALRLITEKTATFGGRILRCGDGQVDAAFGLEPTEDAAARAGYAALAIRRRSRARRRTTPTTSSAWRSSEGIGPDAIVVGAGAVPYLDRQFSFATADAVGDRNLTVLARPHAFEAGRASPFGRSPFLGRTHELTFVEQRLKHVAATGRGYVLGLMGEPGIGKSRLLVELR